MKIIFFKLLRRLKFGKSLNFSFKIDINNVYFTIPVIYQIGFEHTIISELWMINIFKKIININTGSFYDVGVNTGQTLLKLKSVNPGVSYIGFEPNPKCIFYVDELIKANNFKDIKLLPVGLMSENALLELNFFSEADTDSAASLISNFRPNEKTYLSKYVPALNYNSLRLPEDKIGILKIDVEGAELFVIEALLEKIRIDKPIILMEILPCHSSIEIDRIERQKKLEDYFRKLNYKIYRVQKDQETIGIQYISTIEIHSDMNLCEYIIVPDKFEKLIVNAFL
jgi:FkbM family methyltransferase